MNTIPAGPAADNHNKIAALRIFKTFILIHQPDIAAEHQRVGHISVIEINRTVNRRYPHPVTVITNTANHTLHNPPRMQYTLGYFIQLLVRQTKTEYVRVGDRLCTHARPHRVANHTADTSGRSAVRVERRWMIMRFDLKANRVFIIELNNACIIFEN